MGGDTAHETLPVLRALRSANTGALFAYSVEVDEHEAHGDLADGVSKTDVSQRIVNEMIRCIDVADEFETGEVEGGGQKKTWVAVKIVCSPPPPPPPHSRLLTEERCRRRYYPTQPH